ncbi:MAG: CHAT domain-containing tetratricopeptide repeat protein [Casimicrobiaceae bacterium]
MRRWLAVVGVLAVAWTMDGQAQGDPCGTVNPKPGVKNRLEAEYFAAITIGPLPAPRNAGEAQARRMLNEIGSLERAGNPSQAIAELEKLIPLLRRSVGELDPMTPAAMRRLANHYRDLGRSKEALALHRRAYDLRNRICRPNNAYALESLVDVALTYAELGQPLEALPSLEFVVREFQGNLNDGFPIAQQAIRALALAYAQTGRPADALPLVERLQKQPRAMLQTRALSDIAAVYSLLDRPRESAALYERALEIEQKSPKGNELALLTTKNNLATLYSQTGQLDRALELQEEATRAAVRLYGETHPATLAFMHNLATSYGTLHRLPEARRVAERVYALETRANEPQHPAVLRAAYAVAAIAAEQGETAAARAALAGILAAQKSVLGSAHRETLNTAVLLATLTYESGDCAGVIPLATQVVDGAEVLRNSGDLSEENRRGLFARWVPGYKLLAACLAGTGRLDDAFKVSELAKSRTLLESTALAAGLSNTALPEAERERLAQFGRRIAALTEAIARTDKEPLRVTLEADKNVQVRAAADLRRALASRFPRLRELTDIQPIARTQLSTVLPADTVVVTYIVGHKKGFALVVSRERVGYYPLPDITGLGDTAALYLRIIREPMPDGPLKLGAESVWANPDGGFVAGRVAPVIGARRVEKIGELSDWLARRLVAPVLAGIKSATHVVIVPDGALAFLPFETLPADGRLLITRADISYAQSGSLYALMVARQAAYKALPDRRELLAMGGAVYQQNADGATAIRKSRQAAQFQPVVGTGPDGVKRALRAMDLRWENLPGTEQEVDSVAALFSGAVKFKGRDASEATLQRLDRDGSLGKFRYLLFAAHGYLDPAEPALSALVLSQVDNPPGADGYVTAAEWPTYHLRSDLVVLSACETGRGTLVAGEGVLGLPYAFYAAGNTSTVMTLWPVFDQTTPIFMQHFFARLRNGESAARALSAVKREFLAASALASQPAFWAPYVLYGL